MEKREFAERLAKLRTNKGVSARDMSLSIGQSQNYITSIESGRNLPSMTAFFYICEYLGITPAQFFEVEYNNPKMTTELMNASKNLSNEALGHIVEIMKFMK